MVQYFRRFRRTDGSKEYESQSLSSSFRAGSSYLGNRKYEEFKTVSCDVYNRLLSIGKDGFGTSIMACICNLPRKYSTFEGKF